MTFIICENEQFIEDTRNDLYIIYEYFIQLPTIDNLFSIYTEFSLASIAKPAHPKPNEFIYHFFQIIIQEMYYCTIKDNAIYFILLVYLLKEIYFNQKDNEFVLILINLERLESINKYMEFIKLHDCENKDLIFFTENSLVALKTFGAFDVYIDKNTICMDEKDCEIVLQEIKCYENYLKDYEKQYKL